MEHETKHIYVRTAVEFACRCSYIRPTLDVRLPIACDIAVTQIMIDKRRVNKHTRDLPRTQGSELSGFLHGNIREAQQHKTHSLNL